MFAVIKPAEPADNIFSALRLRREYERKEAQAHRTGCGLPFLTLEMYSGKNGIDWKLAEEKCGRYSSRLVVPRNIKVPDIPGIHRFEPRFMPLLLNLNTAAELIKGAGVPPDSFVLTVTDREGNFTAHLSKFLRLCSCVRIITQRQDKYLPVISEAFESSGASVMMRERFEKSFIRDVVVCCDGSDFPDCPDALVFTCFPSVRGALTVFGSGLDLLPEHRSIIGERIDGVDFAGALTELCGCRDYTDAVFSDISLTFRGCSEEFEDFFAYFKSLR